MWRRINRHLSLCLALILAACAARPAEPAQVSFMIFGDAAEKQAYEELVAAFERDNPSIDVTMIHIPGQADYRRRLAADFAAGTPADVVLLNYRRYASFAAKEVLEPLGPYLDRSQRIKTEDFYPEAIEPFYWRGTLACIPQNLSSLAVYYNKDLFAAAGVAPPAPGWTWDDFLAAAQQLTRDTDGDGVIDQYGLGTEVSIFRLAPFIWQNGGDLVDDAASPTRLTLDSPAALEATRWFVELQTRHHVVPDAAQEQAESSESRFLSGRLAMFLNSRRGVPTYRTITAFDWDVAPLPQKVQPAGILHADAYCMARAARNKDAAWAFIEFANSVEGQTIIAGSGRTVPSLRSVAESPAFLDPQAKPENSRVFLDVIGDIRAVPVMETWVDIEDLVGEELERAFYGRASVEEAVAAAVERSAPFFEQH
ncbi:MAG: sugar ABC transporter substrate-binding protein [Chloroflexota bacterium]|nr:MAG: sugar ABC transporter substrate-binding protein [Chloroflexota bacterium]